MDQAILSKIIFIIYLELDQSYWKLYKFYFI